MEVKKCFKCGVEKSIDDFYKHKQMADGHLNKCIDCAKNDVKVNIEKLSKNPNWIEKERERGREKYKRLNYKDRQKEKDKNRHWKQSSKYKGLSKKLKTPKGFELHHWNYNYDFLEDVIILKRSAHKKAHTSLIFNDELLIFKTNDGIDLDTKQKHIQYLLDLGIFNI